MKVTICLPRLDCPFKNLGPISEQRGPLPPIRVHWANFVQCLSNAHENKGDQVTVIEKPLWQFSLDYVEQLAKDTDRLYMPHKQKVDFPAGENVYYWAQTVFPEYFTIDQNGWGANLSYLPLKIDDERAIFEEGYFNKVTSFFEQCRSRIQRNISKFDQPALMDIKDRFDILFVCQIPHDETILYHSDVSVRDALQLVLDDAKQNHYRVLVKGHPVNPGSMSELIQLTKEYHYNATYVCTEISIHDALKVSNVVAMVNSGVGFEAMLHSKVIFTYGRSEYQNVVHYKRKISEGGSAHDLSYKMFLYDFFVESAFNTQDQQQFAMNLK